MPWPKIGATHYHAQLGLPDKGRAIKVLSRSCTTRPHRSYRYISHKRINKTLKWCRDLKKNIDIILIHKSIFLCFD